MDERARVPRSVRDGAVGGRCGWHVCPAGALEVFASREAEEGCTVAACVEHEEGVRGRIAREGEENRAWAWGGTGGGGVAGLTQPGEGGGGEEDDVGVWNELLGVGR